MLLKLVEFWGFYAMADIRDKTNFVPMHPNNPNWENFVKGNKGIITLDTQHTIDGSTVIDIYAHAGEEE